MGRGKSKASKKQKVSECNNMKDDQNASVLNNEEEERKKNQEQDREESEPIIALKAINTGKSENQGHGEEVNTATADSDSGTPPSNDYGRSNNDEDQDEETSEVWDIIRVIPTAEEKIVCRYENCTNQAVATWASNLAPDDKWSLCEKCQLEDFGGWPEGVDPIERKSDLSNFEMEDTTKNGKSIVATIDGNFYSEDHKESPSQGESIDDTSIPIISTPSAAVCMSTQDEPEEMNSGEEAFELSRIVSLQKLLGNPIKCHDQDCNLPACSVYTSKADPKKWYYCVDCQERDFGGWPPPKELPVDYLEPKYLQIIATKCSKKRNPAMPSFNSHCVTPLPISPHPPKGIASASEKVNGKEKPTKFSAAALARHAKWQADAKKLGVNRIVVKKEEAKKVVFDALYDAFRPMNINGIYMTLKKMVPSPVLNAALEDMSMTFDGGNVFDGSDDEDNDKEKEGKGAPEKKPELKESYSGSLVFKAGRNAKSNLYYVDYTKMKEMDGDVRQELASKTAIAEGEYKDLTFAFKQAATRSKQLLSEPTNDELVCLLIEAEKAVVALTDSVNDAKALLVNEGHKNKLKRRIQSMAGHYRKRKQLCCSFLCALEEVSDGAISKKKCLSGDGQIPLDSDESIIKSAIAYAKSKKHQKTRKATLADDKFIGVILDSQGMVKRSYVDEK
ncbi:unnamed protein product [Pseudo-nitzschia multistriata]|uniref:Uncharacterized protein n=1 Tax=Pseudo-nitzschia multistriata TaxID=183589 RepID=A0A448YX05_9STRA|nr:unnamed protein product [Pseudo-nitzschia multistriata]